MDVRRITALAIFALASSCCLVTGAELDIAPSGRVTTWDGARPRRISNARAAAGAANLGVEWDEERDVREVRVRYAGPAAIGAGVEYWFDNWPYDPPHMPSFEDPMDDPWQGKWLKARVSESCEAFECRYEFQPLTEVENERAAKMPGVRYRRTLKVRLVFAGPVPPIAALHVFSGTVGIPLRLRVEFGGERQSAAWSGGVSVYNGVLGSVEPWRVEGGDRTGPAAKGLVVSLVAARPDLPGSHDLTVVTVHAARTDSGGGRDRTFSFSTADLEYGPIAIPEFGARVVDLAAPPAPAHAAGKRRIRQMIPDEPEQTYERASREIPPLDPWRREGGGRVYLPLAPDSSWQKFAFEYGGDVFVSKSGIKAKGDELARLWWAGDRIAWKIGTGAKPYYREDHKVTVHKLDDVLPVVTQRWEHDGLSFAQEAFATLIGGPLSPEDPKRNERTPAVLMMQVTARNRGAGARDAHVWLTVDSGGPISLEGNTVRASGNPAAQLDNPAGASMTIEPVPGMTPPAQGVHIVFAVPANGQRATTIKIVCVSGWSPSALESLRRIGYSSERQRVVAYWKSVVGAATRFSVPEPKFNDLARTVVAQIHISATKDSKTGLYMIPAASYGYDVFENESCYQVLLLDTLGQFDTASRYLEAMMRLQGSKNFPGLQEGSPDGIFHGVKVDDVYDYTAHGYGLDHGTVLWTLAQHYLYSRDRAWLDHAWPHMRKAIAWIESQRSSTKVLDADGEKVREYGLLPASQLEDNRDWANWFSVNAYSWAGMSLTAEALADAGNPEAERIAKEAAAYRSDLRAAILRAARAAPAVRMRDGTYHPYVPVVPARRFRLFGPTRADYYNRYPGPGMRPLLRLGADRDTLCGAVVFLILGVFSPDEPIANWILDDWEDNETLSSGMGMNIHGMTSDRYWFSQGGMVFQANLVNPIQVYLRKHEIPAAIRNLYNDFVACLYPEVNMFTEEFHQWRHGSGPFYKISDESRFVNRVRDMLVFEDGDNLWLAAGAPRRWLGAKDGIRVDRLQTFFGSVSYSLHPGAAPGLLEATVQLPSRNPAAKAWLVARVPYGHIQSVTLDGKPWTNLDPRLEAIQLPRRSGLLKLEIRYR